MKIVDLVPVIDDLSYVKIFEGKEIKNTEFYEVNIQLGELLFYNSNLKSMICNKDYDYLLFCDVISISLQDDYILIIVLKNKRYSLCG